MAQRDFQRLMFDIELPLARMLAGMERVGIQLNLAPLAATADRVIRELAVPEARCHELAGKQFKGIAAKGDLDVIFRHRHRRRVQKQGERHHGEVQCDG